MAASLIMSSPSSSSSTAMSSSFSSLFARSSASHRNLLGSEFGSRIYAPNCVVRIPTHTVIVYRHMYVFYILWSELINFLFFNYRDRTQFLFSFLLSSIKIWIDFFCVYFVKNFSLIYWSWRWPCDHETPKKKKKGLPFEKFDYNFCASFMSLDVLGWSSILGVWGSSKSIFVFVHCL